ncbi:uncharacterized protein LOC129741441 isoform X2 [Uranotaenia lowii]|uniref:uncharacterized protein LOC129741441 isoform X2 n=1 Tax=Uranotaenia lowii TaxID=190385 RepID=UPI002478ED7D|nr:uncharacterized protein LOC129741441 isoform X2 [Uranotaenia lowii]
MGACFVLVRDCCELCCEIWSQFCFCRFRCFFSEILLAVCRRSHLSGDNLIKSEKTSDHANKASKEMSTLYRLWWNAIPDIVSGSGSRTRSKKTSIHRIPRKCPHGTVSRSGSQARSEVVASLGLLFINFRCYTSKGKQGNPPEQKFWRKKNKFA